MDEHTAHRTLLFRALAAALITFALTLAAGPALASAEVGDSSPSPTSGETPHLLDDDADRDLPPVPRFSPSPSPTDDCACDESSVSGEAVWNTIVIIYLISGMLFLLIQMGRTDGSGGRGGHGGSPGGDGGGGGGGVADGGGGGGC